MHKTSSRLSFASQNINTQANASKIAISSCTCTGNTSEKYKQVKEDNTYENLQN